MTKLETVEDKLSLVDTWYPTLSTCKRKNLIETLDLTPNESADKTAAHEVEGIGNVCI